MTTISAALPPLSASNPQQVAQLNQLVGKYKADVSGNASSQVISSLARQITTTASAVGQHVALPRANGGPPAANAAPPPPPPPTNASGKLDLTV